MTAPIYLLHVMAGRKHGGAEEFFTRLAIALQKYGVTQTAIIRHDDARAARLQAAGIDCVQARFGNRWLDLSTHFKIKQTLQDFQPNIVLSWMNRATAFTGAHASKRSFKWAARLGGYYHLKYYRGCDYLIGNTPDIVDYLIKEGWPAERALYLPNFADTQTATPLPRATFNTPAAAPLFLALGRLHVNKGFDTLLQALAQTPQAYLWLAGEGDERSALEKQASELGITDRLRFLGWQENTAALYTAADYFICPSRHEPLGNVVLEAMAHGKPIIATNSQGPGQLLQHEASGLLVPVDDAAAMAMAMQRLMENPGLAHALATTAHAHYQAKFSEDSVCEKYIAAFRKMLERR